MELLKALPAGQSEDSKQDNLGYPFSRHILSKRWTVVHGVKLIMDVVKIQVHQLQPQGHRWQIRRGLA